MRRRNLPRTRQEAAESTVFATFQEEINRLLDQFRSGFPAADDKARSMFASLSFTEIDIAESEDALEITAEVSGVKEEDPNISISGDTLILKGEKSAEHEEKEDSCHLIERRYGSFRRHIPSGFAPENGGVDATFAEGVLKLQIAKPATARTGVQKVNICKS